MGGANLVGLLPVLLQVLFIDLVLAGDNAVVIGLAVNGLPEARRRAAIWAGIAGATLIRIFFALVAVRRWRGRRMTTRRCWRPGCWCQWR